MSHPLRQFCVPFSVSALVLVYVRGFAVFGGFGGTSTEGRGGEGRGGFRAVMSRESGRKILVDDLVKGWREGQMSKRGQQIFGGCGLKWEGCRTWEGAEGGRVQRGREKHRDVS